jgi:hypothetical protein
MTMVTSLHAAGWIVCRLDRLLGGSAGHTSTFVDKRQRAPPGGLLVVCKPKSQRVTRMQILKTIDHPHTTCLTYL